MHPRLVCLTRRPRTPITINHRQANLSAAPLAIYTHVPYVPSLIGALHAEERLQARDDAGEAGLLDGLDDEIDGLVGLRRLVDHRAHLLIEAHVAQRAQHLRA